MAQQNENVSKEKILIKPSSQDKETIFKLISNPKCVVDIQKKLQTLDFNVNTECDKDGDFLLHIAVRKGMTYLPLLMALVEHLGADIDLCNAEGMTPLMLAAAAGNYALCDVLICLFGADPNKPNAQSGRSALHYAAEGQHRKTVECLIHRGADINMEDHDGCRADDILTSGSDDCKDIIAFNRLRRIEMLSDMVRKSEILPSQLVLSDLCVVNNEGQTLIMIAAAHNKFTLLHHLLEVSKSTMNAQHCKTGMTALAISARLGHVEAVGVLLRHKACPLIADIAGYLPLHHAVINNHEIVVDIFLDYFHKQCVGLYKAMHLCREPSILAKLKLAWDKRQEKIVAPKLLECAVSGNAEDLFQLLEEGDNINQKGGIGIWPLYLAAENGHLEVLQLLYESGGDITKRHPVTQDNLLHVAAKLGHLNIVDYLLLFCKNSQKNFPSFSHQVTGHRRPSKSNKCHETLNNFLDINSMNRDNKTALQLAAERGFSQIVHLLLSHGATTTMLDNYGELLLRFSHFEGIQVAIETRRQQHTHEIMESIEEKSGKALSVLNEIWLPRFDHYLRNNEGSTPLMVAAKTGDIQILQFLLKSAVYPDEVQSESERGSNVNNDSDTDSGVIDLTTGSPQDYNYNDDEFEISLDTNSHNAFLQCETQQDYWRSSRQGHCNALTHCSDYIQTSPATHVNRQKSQSIYHDGLISHLCAVNFKDGNNVLHYAIQNSDAPHILALCLEYDPTPLNMQDDKGETVVHLACRLGQKKSLQLLLERPDLNLNIRTFHGHLPEQLSFSKTIQKMVLKTRASSAGLLQNAR